MSKRSVRHVRRHMAGALLATRRSLNITQKQLGARADITPKFIGEVEREEKSPSCDTIWRLTIALRRAGARVTPADMFPVPR